jgi:E3 ubiquitin-protein ligase SHPRH
LLSQTKSKLERLKARVSVKDDDITGNVGAITEVAGENSSAAGAIWSDVVLSLEQSGTTVTAKFEFQLWWNDTPSPFMPLRSSKEQVTSKTLIRQFFPRGEPTNGFSVRSPRNFYEAAHTPSKDDETPLSIDVPGLHATLFPYQKRTLQWLLNREGVQWSSSQLALEARLDDRNNSSKSDTLRIVRDENDNEVYLSDVFQAITKDPTAYRQIGLGVKGGILAEEMGLGKTLEILGLILLHTRNDFAPAAPNGATSETIPSGATLIVSPESLRAQWLSEITRHAPGLRVKYYEGCKKLGEEADEELAADLAGFDIVITTYSVLSAEIHFAAEPPQRSRRHERVYPRTKSPLVQISWWRVCLDEAQMIENGFSQAASVARMIPRTNSWGITGTPVRDDVKDLFGLLLFLRYEPYCSNSLAWQGLLAEDKGAFQQLFNSISLRHTKAMVRDEIDLPPQKRFVISMPFTAVEEQHYQSLFKEMAEACQLTVDGGPAVDDWDAQDHVEAMRTWLDRLRQTALHPEVGVYNRRILGQNRNRPMRTVDEVLDAMLEQSESAIRSEERAFLSTKLTRGQLYENGPRVKEALAIWESVRNETAKLVTEARDNVKDAARKQGINPGQEDDADLGVSDSDDDDLIGSDKKERTSEHRRRLRGALELHHKAVFFCANAYFQISGDPEMTEPGSDEFQRLKKLEEEGYEDAKVLRRELLRGSHGKVNRLMRVLTEKASNQSFTEIPELAIDGEVGIETGTIVNGLEALYGDLNSQADLLDEWREHVVQLLLRPLVDEEGEVETTGEELMDSAKMQEELMVYVQALRAVIADRQEAITGQSNELVRYETDTSLRMAKEGDGPAPETLIELFGKRAMMKPQVVRTTMRGSIGDFRSLQTRLARATKDPNHEATPRELMELRIASRQLTATQSSINEQNKAIISLESEIESFTATMNARLEYYRQLQAVSDSVNPYDGPKTEEAMSKLQNLENDSWRKFSSAQAKHRYRKFQSSVCVSTELRLTSR